MGRKISREQAEHERSHVGHTELRISVAARHWSDNEEVRNCSEHLVHIGVHELRHLLREEVGIAGQDRDLACVNDGIPRGGIDMLERLESLGVDP